MASSSTPSSPKEKAGKKHIERLKVLLEERDTLLRHIADAQAQHEARQKEEDDLFAKELGEAPVRMARVDDEIAKIVSRHHYWLTQALSKTMKIGQSVVKVVIRGKETDVLKGERAVAEKVLEMFGETYVSLNPKLLHKAIAQAPPDELALMQPLGVRVRRHLTVSVQSPIDTESHQIYKRPYDEPKRKKAKESSK